jgi:hypothetical protein
MKMILITLSLLPTLLLAHSGHPGPESHGDAAHLILGIVVAFPLLFLLGFVGLHVRKRATAKVSKKD